LIRRRTLLQLGLGGTALAFAGGAGLWGLRGRAPRVDGLRCLTDHEYRTVRHLAATIIPRGGVFPQGADDYDVARAFDGFLADEPHENRRDLKRALALVEYGPVLFERRLTTFSNLDDAARRAHWERWETSDSHLRRKVATAFRRFVCLVFYDHASVWAHIGYGRATVVGEAD
jgi:hypothetical protein